MGTRAITWTINYPSGEPWSNGVVTAELLQGFTTATEVYPATTTTFTSDADGTEPAGAALGVPDSGTAYYKITKPNGVSFRVYLAAGAAVDLVTLETIAGSSVAQDDLQTLIDAGEVYAITAVNALYQALATDEYIYCTGTTYTVTLAACTLGTTKPLIIENRCSGNVTVDGSGAETVNGAATLTLYPGDRRAFIPIATGAWSA